MTARIGHLLVSVHRLALAEVALQTKQTVLITHLIISQTMTISIKQDHKFKSTHISSTNPFSHPSIPHHSSRHYIYNYDETTFTCPTATLHTALPTPAHPLQTNCSPAGLCSSSLRPRATPTRSAPAGLPSQSTPYECPSPCNRSTCVGLQNSWSSNSLIYRSSSYGFASGRCSFRRLSSVLHPRRTSANGLQP